MKKKYLLIALLPFVAIAIVLIAVIGVQVALHRQAVQKELATCSALWEEGKRADAVDQYKGLIENDLKYMPKSDKTTVVNRVVEFEAERGNTESAKRYIELAWKESLSLSVNEPKAKELVAQVQTEREAADRAKKEAAVRAKTEAAEKAEKERQAQIAAAELKKKERLENEAAEQAKKRAEEQAERDKAIAITAEKLVQEYQDNSVRANQQYQGKMLKVSGPMKSTDTGLFNKVIVYIETSGRPVECSFREVHKDHIAKLDKGQFISITGRCSNGGDYGVMMSECELRQVKTEGTVPLTGTGTKLVGFRAIVEKLNRFPDRFAPAVERMKYADELRKLFNSYEAIPFDPKANRDEAKQIIDLFEKRVSGKYSGQEYNLIEASVLIMAQKLME